MIFCARSPMKPLTTPAPSWRTASLTRPFAPKGLIRQLAADAIEVAAPILSRSSVLSEEDLVTIVHETGQAHIQAIAKRETVSERLSHAIVEKGDDDTVATLIRNDGAQLARSTYEQVARRAEDSEILQEPLVERADAPPTFSMT
jgi:uncharacterized protein (DUF2336 family)